MALALVALTIMGASEATAKRRQLSHIYMFGLAASFTDSTVYFTEIQTVDSTWIDDKTFFLENREVYSQQLKDYLAASMLPNRVCVVMYAPTLKEAEKKYVQVRRIYTTKADTPYDVHYLTNAEFRFKTVPSEIEDEPAAE